MKKPGWDGSFDSPECKYTYTDNIVGDVIENGGRILHEPTVDGYTHELTDRGSYISDDYYFPQRESGKKPHIHYEIRSTGEILIDGKPITTKRTGGNTAMYKMKIKTLNRGIDGTKIGNDSDKAVGQAKNLDKLGEDFLADKAKLEQAFEEISNSTEFDDKHKRAMLQALNESVRELQQDYEARVTKPQEKVQEELREQTEVMQEAADAMQEQSDSLRSIQMDVAATDTDSAADAADAEKQKFDQMKAEYVEKLNLQIQQQQLQKREIQRRRLSGG